jgi:hypothetical protein
MYLVQILLPLFDNRKKAIPKTQFRKLAAELTTRFGGVTAYSHAPAEGRWQKRGGQTSRDQIIVYEVMSKTLERNWWRRKRASLEHDFRQERIVIRSYRVTQL